MSKVGRNNHERINSVRAALVVSLHWCGHMGGIEPTVCRDATNRVLFRIVRTENTHDCAKTSFLTLHPRRQSAGLSARARLNERRPELVQPKLAEGQESRWLLQATGVESDQSAAVRPRQVPPLGSRWCPRAPPLPTGLHASSPPLVTSQWVFRGITAMCVLRIRQHNRVCPLLLLTVKSTRRRDRPRRECHDPPRDGTDDPRPSRRPASAADVLRGVVPAVDGDYRLLIRQRAAEDLHGVETSDGAAEARGRGEHKERCRGEDRSRVLATTQPQGCGSAHQTPSLPLGSLCCCMSRTGVTRMPDKAFHCLQPLRRKRLWC